LTTGDTISKEEVERAIKEQKEEIELEGQLAQPLNGRDKNGFEDTEEVSEKPLELEVKE
jgi:hypothetical protein